MGRPMHTPSTQKFKQALHELQSLFKTQLATQKAICDAHGRDEGIVKAYPPHAVLFAQTAQDVQKAVQICAQHRMPIIPYGAGTSLEGHISAPWGGLSIDLSGMNQILAVNGADLDVRVEPGVTRQQLNAHLRDKGFFFPVDPGAECTLGGMVSTRASGTNAVRYGTMREQVLSLQVITPSGDIIETGTRAKKSAAGYDLTHLYTGAEGTLGIITGISLKIYGIPEKLMAGTCRFPDMNSAIETVIATIQMGLPVSRIELLDETSIKAVNQYAHMSHVEKPTLFLEFAGTEKGVEEQISLFTGIADEIGANAISFAEHQEDINRLWHARHQLYYATRAMAKESHVFSTDVCVPISRLGDCMLETRTDLQASGLFATMLGHVGDGNFHTIIATEPDNAEQMQIAENLNSRMVRRAIEMGGTCTGEHGIGAGKRQFLEWERGSAVTVMQQLKTALDPHNIMNPGKIFL